MAYPPLRYHVRVLETRVAVVVRRRVCPSHNLLQMPTRRTIHQQIRHVHLHGAFDTCLQGAAPVLGRHNLKMIVDARLMSWLASDGEVRHSHTSPWLLQVCSSHTLELAPYSVLALEHAAQKQT